MRRLPVALLMLLLFLAACTSEDSAPPSQPVPAVTNDASTTEEPPGESDGESAGSGNVAPSPATVPEIETQPTETELVLEPVFQIGAATAFATRPGRDSLFVAEQRGQIFEVALGDDGRAAGQPREILDLRDHVLAQNERGLLGIDFSPEGDRLYAVFTNSDGHNSLVSWAVAADGSVDVESELPHLEVFQPFSNHNGGQITFGPDGYLYYALGDGGGGGDPDGNAQNLATLLGSILRIEPDPVAGGYSVPPDNPFVDLPGAAPEIWVHGFRNPWRFAFDSSTGDLWIGDVGQDDREEINLLSGDDYAGANLGWNAFEGTHRFSDTDAPGHVPPLVEYTHGDGRCSVIGGFVYRGTAIPSLDGVYLYSDHCDGVIRGVVPGVGSGPLVASESESGVSFGEGPDGEIYFVGSDGIVYRLEPQSS